MKSKNKLKQKKQPKNFKYFDTSITYMCPMIRKDSKYPNEVDEITEVILKEDYLGYWLIPLNNDYNKKFFYDLYLDWLFYTKYIVVKG